MFNFGASRCLYFAVTLVLAAFCAPAQATVKAAVLRCELLIDPLGVDVAQPRLIGLMLSEERGQAHTAYQVLVASSRDLLKHNRPDLWDSGRVASDATVDVAYAGKPLASAQQVFWKVRVWDAAGRISAWSPVAAWTTGVLSEKDWNAGIRWITDPGLLRWVRPRLGFRSQETTDENGVKWVLSLLIIPY